MAKQRFWIAGAAMAALAAVPLSKAGQASAQPTKVAQAQLLAVQAAVRPEQSSSQPQALNREGRPVRVVYGAPASAR